MNPKPFWIKGKGLQNAILSSKIHGPTILLLE